MTFKKRITRGNPAGRGVAKGAPRTASNVQELPENPFCNPRPRGSGAFPQKLLDGLNLTESYTCISP